MTYTMMASNSVTSNAQLLQLLETRSVVEGEGEGGREGGKEGGRVGRKEGGRVREVGGKEEER